MVARGHGFRASDRDRVVRDRGAGVPGTWQQFAAMRTLDVWYDRTDADDVIAHFPRRYRAEASAT